MATHETRRWWLNSLMLSYIGWQASCYDYHQFQQDWVQVCYWLRANWLLILVQNFININLSRILPRISIYAQNVYLETLQNPIEKGADQPWPSRSFWTLTDQFSQVWACLYNSLTRIQPRICIFAQNVYLRTPQNPIENEVNWPWPSRSFWT